MAILNYSGLLQGGAMGAGERSAGLAGLLQNQKMQRDKMQMLKDDRAAAQQASQADMQAREVGAQLLREGTPEQIAEFGIKNPNVMKDFISMASFQDQQAESGRLNYAKSIISGAVEPMQALQSRIAEVEARGGDASGLRRTLELGSDEAIIEAANKDFAVLDPQGYKVYQQATMQGQPKANGQSAASIQELKQYQSMPEGAEKEAYGRKVGLISKEGFELSAPVIKIIEQADSDYRESQVNAGRYENLANQFDNLKSFTGVASSAYEKFKELSGNQDEVTDLKKRYTRIVNKQVMASLPPGAASDVDVAYARKGFLDDNANPKQVASFLRGISKLEKAKSLYSEWRSNYVSETGSLRGITKEWNKYRKSDEYKQRYKSLTDESNAIGESKQDSEVNFASMSDEELING